MQVGKLSRAVVEHPADFNTRRASARPAFRADIPHRGHSVALVEHGWRNILVAGFADLADPAIMGANHGPLGQVE
jgi:hypothetical protein